MKKKNPRGRPPKYSKDDPQAIIKISLAESLKMTIERRAKEECGGNVSEYAVRALVHYMTCDKVALAKLYGKEVQLSNGANIRIIEPPEDFDPISLFKSAVRIVESAIACRVLKHYRTMIDLNENYRLSPELIRQIEKEYNDFDKLVGTLKEQKRHDALCLLFDIMLSEFDRLKGLPEYIDWLGLIYGFEGPSIDEFDDE